MGQTVLGPPILESPTLESSALERRQFTSEQTGQTECIRSTTELRERRKRNKTQWNPAQYKHDQPAQHYESSGNQQFHAAEHQQFHAADNRHTSEYNQFHYRRHSSEYRRYQSSDRHHHTPVNYHHTAYDNDTTEYQFHHPSGDNQNQSDHECKQTGISTVYNYPVHNDNQTDNNDTPHNHYTAEHNNAAVQFEQSLHPVVYNNKLQCTNLQSATKQLPTDI